MLLNDFSVKDLQSVVSKWKFLFVIIKDVLLCHDDELEGRRIAYIYYLVPLDWEEKDGGRYFVWKLCLKYM